MYHLRSAARAIQFAVRVREATSAQTPWPDSGASFFCLDDDGFDTEDETVEDEEVLLRRTSANLTSVPGRPHIFAGFARSFESLRRSTSAGSPASVRIKVVRKLGRGDQIIENSGEFEEQCGRILVEIGEKPEFAPTLGIQDTAVRPREVRKERWRQQAGFFAFLRCLGAVESDSPVSQDFLERIGVKYIEDDGFCGVHALACILKCSFRQTLDMVKEAIGETREGEQQDPDEQRLWNFADVVLQNLGNDDYPNRETFNVSQVSRDLMSRQAPASISAGFAVTSMDYRLSDGDLVRLCSKLGLAVPIVNVQEDFDGMRMCNDFSMLAKAARGTRIWREEFDQESWKTTGEQLNAEGYCLITVETHNQGLVWQDLKRAPALMIGCDGHYFILSRSTSVTTRLPPTRPPPRRMLSCSCFSGMHS